MGKVRYEKGYTPSLLTTIIIIKNISQDNSLTEYDLVWLFILSLNRKVYENEMFQ